MERLFKDLGILNLNNNDPSLKQGLEFDRYQFRLHSLGLATP